MTQKGKSVTLTLYSSPEGRYHWGGGCPYGQPLWGVKVRRLWCLGSEGSKGSKGDGGGFAAKFKKGATEGGYLTVASIDSIFLSFGHSYSLFRIPFSAHSLWLFHGPCCLFPSTRPAVPGRSPGGCRRFLRSPGSSLKRCGSIILRAARRYRPAGRARRPGGLLCLLPRPEESVLPDLSPGPS